MCLSSQATCGAAKDGHKWTNSDENLKTSKWVANVNICPILHFQELRDLVRSLGRGGGWGPLRRAPIQFFDLKGRDGLLRTILEQQETRGLTRSDDISRLLPGEAALIARGRQIRQAKLLFYSKLAEKALSTYERDGWGEFPTNIVPERREIRPTADRGPILLCVDTSGSMQVTGITLDCSLQLLLQGPREVVAKALTLECMRAAKEQDRGCYVFAFSGPREVFVICQYSM